MSPRSTLIAIGGNALIREGEPGSIPVQQERSAAFGEAVAGLVGAGLRVIVTHGNGPQVGYILRRGELVADEAGPEGLPDLPLWLAVADSQGGIGHMLALGIDRALEAAGRSERAIGVLTHCQVRPDDSAFANPTKPIGGVLDAETAERRVRDENWSVAQVEPGVFRRVVPSPVPEVVIETPQVQTLIDSGTVVIAAGGGGIPVVRDAAGWRPVDAVIDKDRASALLAKDAGIDTLVLVTGVDHVFVDFGTPQQRALDVVDTATLRQHLADGQFPPGSMGPKIASAIDFVEQSSGEAIITSLDALAPALAGRAGTRIVRGAAALSAPDPRSSKEG